VGSDESLDFHVGNERRSAEDIIKCQEGIHEFSNFQVGNEMRSMEDLMNYQEGSGELSNCQVGNEVRSVDLIYCQGLEIKFQYVRWERERI
jgi:hypothetical protein